MHFIKTSLIPKEFSKILRQARDERELSDYADFFETATDESAEQIKNAEHFIKMTINFLKDRGLNFDT